jgi:DNA-binding IclR family transcriptional regulator
MTKRTSYLAVVQHVWLQRASDRRGVAARRKVLAVLCRANAGLSIAQIAAAAGLSYFSARRALERLVPLHAVRRSGPGNNLRFSVAVAGFEAGGQASESADGARDGLARSPSARPGSVAA